MFSMLMVLVMHLSLKLNKAPESAAKDDPTGPSVALVGTRLYFTGWIDILRRVSEGSLLIGSVKQEIEYLLSGYGNKQEIQHSVVRKQEQPAFRFSI
jgi:hypothetical protein